jgi:serine/threonine protein kinase
MRGLREVHGDGKPENVLLPAVASRLALKLSDFTASCLLLERARSEDSIPPIPPPTSLPL